MQLRPFAPALLFCALCSSAAAQSAIPGCDVVKEIPTGKLCVIKPSKTDPLIKDLGPTAYGFGDHVVGLPTNAAKGVWIHLTGTGGKPYNPQNLAMPFPNEVLLNEFMGQGYTVIQLAYDNAVAVGESCATDSPGADLNNCAGDARLEVITGADASPLREVDVPNSVTFRVRAVLDYMNDNDIPLPEGAYPFNDWTQVSVSGHSQGAGHAYYIAKYFGSKFACFFGGPYDPHDNVPEPPIPAKRIADWYLDKTTNKTPVKNMGAFLTTADEHYNGFTAAYRIIGLEKDQEWFEADKRRYTDGNGKVVDGHAAAVKDPSLASLRAQACFR